MTDNAMPIRLLVFDVDGVLTGNLPFLAVVGYSTAPDDANLEVKQLVQYVALRSAADGVRDILDYFGLTS